MKARFSSRFPLILLFFCNYLSSSIEEYYPYKIYHTASSYGETGLIEMPSAYFMEEASLRFTFSTSFPYEFTSLTASPFPWMEATYRYTEIKNELYGPSTYSGNQSDKDKGFDIRFRFLKESSNLPAVAAGIRDIAGTGRFSSEYLVASKTIGNMHFSTGLGWGILGSEGGIANPLSSLSERFNLRNADQGDGGSFRYNDWFSGKTSLFAGLEYDLPIYGLKFKLEYDTSEPDANFKNPLPVQSRFNFGLEYLFHESLSFGVSFERGNQLRTTFALKGNFLRDTIGKVPPKNVIKADKTITSLLRKDKNLFYRSLNKSLKDEDIFIQGATYNEEMLEVSVASPRYSSLNRTAGRTIRISSALIDENIETIKVNSMNGDLELISYEIPVDYFSKANEKLISSEELIMYSRVFSESDEYNYAKQDFKPKVNFPEFYWNMAPALRHQIGGPEAFYLGQLWWKTDTRLKIARNLALYTTLGLNIYNNFDEFANPSQSTIPHVRSDIQEYLKEGKNNIQRMNLEYMTSPLNDIFMRFDLGLLEDMFGGYGGEIYYRPFKKSYSMGFRLHKVYQRGYDQKFSFRDYETETGHLTFHKDFNNKVTLTTYLGKYLAGDKGITLDLQRRFSTGFSLGIFATKTNLSSEEFGEGSFDKGFYFAIPTSLFFRDHRPGAITFGMHPLTKDGGALLNTSNSLHGIIYDSGYRNTIYKWKDFLD
tara:strand:- start:1228 stop:3357 length:2130 start_codon:yes stop_codon:yes gene_type:complete